MGITRQKGPRAGFSGVLVVVDGGGNGRSADESG